MQFRPITGTVIRHLSDRPQPQHVPGDRFDACSRSVIGVPPSTVDLPLSDVRRQNAYWNDSVCVPIM